MYKLLISFLILIVHFNISAKEFKNKKIYYYHLNKKIKPYTLTGIKKLETVKDFRDDEKSINIYTINFKEPIIVSVKPGDEPDEFSETETIKKIHLVAYEDAEKIANGCVIVTGRFYHAENAHINTKVYMAIDDLKSCK